MCIYIYKRIIMNNNNVRYIIYHDNYFNINKKRFLHFSLEYNFLFLMVKYGLDMFLMGFVRLIRSN